MQDLKDAYAAFVAEVKNLAGTRAFWFLLGLSLSGQTVPQIVAAVKTFIGV